MPDEIVDQPAVLADLLGSAAVTDAGRLHDRGIVAHVVDDPDKAVIEDGHGLVENLLQRRRNRPKGRLRTGPSLVDFCLLIAGEGHLASSFVGRGLYGWPASPSMGKSPGK